MTQPYLYARLNSVTEPQIAVFKEINMQLIQVGSDFGTTELFGAVGPVSYRGGGSDRVIHWENDLFCVNGDNIFKYDVTNSGSWDVFYTFAVPNANLDKRAGLVACSIDGSGLLCTAYGVGSNTFRIVKIDKDLNVTETPTTTRLGGTMYGAFGAFRDWCGLTAHRNSMVWTVGIIQSSTTRPIGIYDLKDDNFVEPLLGGGNLQSPESNIVIYRDKIFTVCTLASTPDLIRLYRVDGGTLTTVAGFGPATGAGAQGSNDGGGQGLIVLNDKLYVMALGATNSPQTDGFWSLREITLDANLDFVSDVDVSSKLPSSLTGGVDRRNHFAFFRLDSLTSSGVVSNVEMMVGDNEEATTQTLHRWQNAPAGDIIAIENGMDGYRFSKIHSQAGGSERIWSGSGTINVSQPCLQINGPNIQAKFKVWGEGQSGISAQLLWSLNDTDATKTLGTLVSTNVGTLNGNTVEDLVADGTTEVNVAWAAALDGVLTGDNPRAAIRVFIP